MARLPELETPYHKKMAPKREGPFEIEEVIGPVTYRLKLPETWKIHMYSMQPYYDLTWKMKYMEIIILDHHLNSLKEKKYTKSKISLDIKEEDEDINTTSNGKDIRSLK